MPHIRMPRLRLPRLRFPSVRQWSRRRLLLSVAVLLCGIAVPAAWWQSCGFEGCPTRTQLRAWRPTEGGVVYDMRGAAMGPLTTVKRINVPLKVVPRHVRDAFIAVEDRRFRQHHGVDWRGVARATVANVRALGVREGASTITMQLAKNVFLADRAGSRTFGRKLLEWRLAGLLEHALTKDEILERYLNAIYLGNGVFGVEAASRDLFGKSVRQLSIAEAAMLSGLPKAPSSYSPRRDLARARMRRDIALTVLEREHVASSRAIADARAESIALADHEWTPDRSTDSWALEVARSVVDSLRKAGQLPRRVTDEQLIVRTTFDRRAQRAAERAIAHGASRLDGERGVWSGSAGPATQGALVALDPRTGAIRALVGGRSVERRGFNRALSARRQPGSAFKPFVYAAALQHGFTTATLVDDEPISIDIGRDVWTPANYNDDYAGRITLRHALIRSANAATVRVSRDIGNAPILAQAHAQGIQSSLPDVPSLALGAGGVTPLELTAAYAPFGNGGLRVTPYAILEINDAFGRPLWRAQLSATHAVLDPADAFLMTSMLRSVVDEGTGRAVRAAGIRGPVAGKTGTTNDGTDVWFVGATPTIVASVWFGADSPRSLGSDASGGRLAAPAWSEFLRDGWHSPQRDTAWMPPPTLIAREIDDASGQLASNWCGESRRDWFKPGTEPRDACNGDMVANNPPELDAPAPPMPPMPPPSSGRGWRGVIAAVPQRTVDRVLDRLARAVGGDSDRQKLAHQIARELRRAAEQQRRMVRQQTEAMQREMAQAAERMADAHRGGRN